MVNLNLGKSILLLVNFTFCCFITLIWIIRLVILWQVTYYWLKNC